MGDKLKKCFMKNTIKMIGIVTILITVILTFINCASISTDSSNTSIINNQRDILDGTIWEIIEINEDDEIIVKLTFHDSIFLIRFIDEERDPLIRYGNYSISDNIVTFYWNIGRGDGKLNDLQNTYTGILSDNTISYDSQRFNKRK